MLEAKFFGLFRVLYPVRKQTYKLELPKKWRIHELFHRSFLEQDSTWKRRAEEGVAELDFKGNGDGDGDSEEYKVETICDSAVYARESEGQLPGFYYLLSWKGYPAEKNTWEPASAIQYLCRLVSTFHKENPEKLTAISTLVDSAPSLAKPTVKPGSANKRKRGQPTKATGTNKRAKKN